VNLRKRMCLNNVLASCVLRGQNYTSTSIWTFNCKGLLSTSISKRKSQLTSDVQ